MQEVLQELVREWSYLGIALFLWGTGFGFPLPEDICLLLAGWLCGEGGADVLFMVPLTMFCVLGSDCVIYFLGWKWGLKATKWWPFCKFLSEEKLARSEAMFHNHGGKMLFGVRFMPLVRAPSFFTAGTFKYPFHKFLFYDGLAALLSVPTLVILGYYFHDRFEEVKQWSRQGQVATAIIVGACAVAYITWKVIKSKRKAKAAAKVQTNNEANAKDNTTNNVNKDVNKDVNTDSSDITSN
jgi:membrane protein DedA with SNARE-associated domain